jgi:rhodanese-related sulfurtransferase
MKVMLRALVLVGLGIVIGCVHSQVGERPATSLSQPQPQPPSGGNKAAGDKGGAPAAAGDPRPGGEKTPDVIKTPGNDNSAPVAVTPIDAPKTGSVPPPTPPAAAATNPAEKYFITLAKAKELYDQKAKGQWDGIFIDARGYDDYTKGHIPGSMHIDKKYFDGAVPKKVKLYLPGTEVVIYCHGEQCTDSEAVAIRLQALKLNIGPMHIIKDGYPGWVASGYPTAQGGEEGFSDR